jgi:hypothetical protein
MDDQIPTDNLPESNPTPELAETSTQINTSPIPINTSTQAIGLVPAPELSQQTNTVNPAANTGDIAGGISLDNVDAGFGAFARRKWWVIVLSVVGTIVLTVILVIAKTNFVFGILPLVGGIGYLRKNYENSLFGAFAVSNHFNYQKNGTLLNQLGIIFSIGRDRRFYDIVSGTYQNWDFNLFMYKYTIGYGRNSQTYDRAVMEVNFNIELPSFVLRRHKIMGILEEEGESLRRFGYTEKINLEGDFNKHFEVFIKPNSQVDVLSILTPDIMEILIGLDKYELELTPNGIFYVYCRGYISNKESLIDIYKIVEAITEKIGSYAKQEKVLNQVSGNQPAPININ